MVNEANECQLYDKANYIAFIYDAAGAGESKISIGIACRKGDSWLDSSYMKHRLRR